MTVHGGDPQSGDIEGESPDQLSEPDRSFEGQTPDDILNDFLLDEEEVEPVEEVEDPLDELPSEEEEGTPDEVQDPEEEETEQTEEIEPEEEVEPQADDTPDLSDLGVEDRVESMLDAHAPDEDWNKTPATVRKLFREQRSYARQVERDLTAERQVADVTRNILDSADKVGIKPDVLEQWLGLTYRMQAGDRDAVHQMGDILYNAGYRQQTADPQALDQYLGSLVRDAYLEESQVAEIKKMIQPKAAAAPVPQPQVADPQVQVREQALKVIDQITERYKAAAPDGFDRVHKRAHEQFILKQAATPTDPSEWPKAWAEAMKKSLAEHRKRSKAQRTRRRQNTVKGSDSLASTGGTGSRNRTEARPADEFLKGYTY